MPALKENHPLAKCSTFGIGGPARYFIEVKTSLELADAMKTAKKLQLPFLILGKGSNCLFSDQGFEGLVILNKIDFLENPAPGVFRVGAGYSFSLLGAKTARMGWSGLEFASGIPGSVGGAVYMNAGANGCETADTLCSVEYIEKEGCSICFSKSELQFGYRASLFQNLEGAIAGAEFRLNASSEARKKQIEIITYRKETQPYREKSAGCVFRNSSVGAAGALIEKCGLKGAQVGGATVSPIHANFIVNTGTATAQDIMELMDLVERKVKETTGVELKKEVQIIPYRMEKR